MRNFQNKSYFVTVTILLYGFRICYFSTTLAILDAEVLEPFDKIGPNSLQKHVEAFLVNIFSELAHKRFHVKSE